MEPFPDVVFEVEVSFDLDFSLEGLPVDFGKSLRHRGEVS